MYTYHIMFERCALSPRAVCRGLGFCQVFDWRVESHEFRVCWRFGSRFPMQAYGRFLVRVPGSGYLVA